MEATQSYPNLLSEKQAASRLGIARITLLRARDAGRIKFFRIGTRILYSEAQLIEFLNACEQEWSWRESEWVCEARREKEAQSSQRPWKAAQRQLCEERQSISSKRRGRSSIAAVLSGKLKDAALTGSDSLDCLRVRTLENQRKL